MTPKATKPPAGPNRRDALCLGAGAALSRGVGVLGA